MTRAILALLLVQAYPLWAQFDLLTPLEAARIIEQIPPVVRAAKDLRCPILTDVAGIPQNPATLDVEVRAACGSFHERYVVNRETGTVATWGDTPEKVRGPASEALAKQLVARARSRLLSLRERRCIALEAARSLPAWNGAGGSTTIEAWDASSSSADLSFQLRRRFSAPPSEYAVLLYVDPRTGHVRNLGSSAEVMSAGLGELLAELIALKSPELLSDRDALSIALKVPAVAAILERNDCSLVVSNAFTPEEAQIAPACGGYYLDKPRVIVKLRDGLVLDAETRKAMDVPGANSLAKGLVSARHASRLQIQNEVEAKCGELQGR
jgi:hypothetical protein